MRCVLMCAVCCPPLQVGNSWRTGIDVFAAWDAAQAKALKLPNFLQPILGAVRQTQVRVRRGGRKGWVRGCIHPPAAVLGFSRARGTHAAT